ncbi:MAG: cob(I)yrinic acid a,c-diamide adenosyltransferase [bacterium]
MIVKGLNIIFTGSGKGKTTAALGLLLRAAGNGKKVAVYQFIKGRWKTGELKAVQAFEGLVEFRQLGEGFLDPDSSREKAGLKAKAETDYELVKSAVLHPQADMIILDEIIYMVSYGLIKEKKVLELMRRKPETLHLIMTGRGATPALIEAADLVSEMTLIKHPLKKGVKAQPGIEF